MIKHLRERRIPACIGKTKEKCERFSALGQSGFHTDCACVSQEQEQKRLATLGHT